MSKQLYDRHGRPYVSKKQKKKQAFRERVRKANASLQDPSTQQSSKVSETHLKIKSKRQPKYKILKKVMAYDEIPSFIERVTHDLNTRKPYVPDTDIPWNESGVIESGSCPKQDDPQQPPRFGESEKSSVMQEETFCSKLKKQTFSLRGRRIHEFYQELMRAGMQLPQPSMFLEPYMLSHPMFCTFHSLVGHKLEDCRGFKKWVFKMVRAGVIRLSAEYFDLPSTCYALTFKESHDEEEEKLNGTTHNVRKMLEQARGFKDKGKGKAIEINEEIALHKAASSKTQDYNIAAHLKKIPAQLSVFDALMLSQELRDTLIHVLQNPEEYQAYFAETHMTEALYAFDSPSIHFSDKDLLLGTKEHNRPLYVTGFYDGIRVNRILIDPGSSVNLITLKTLHLLTLETYHLSTERIVIQGFNQHSQKALGSITLPIKIGKLISEVKFHVINTDASYRALLGRPWLHENYVVPSTLHQCIKYIQDDEVHRVEGEIQPFGVHEIHYDDARYFVDRPRGGKLSAGKDDTLLKVTKTTKLTQEKVSIMPLKPHLGNDIESSEEEANHDDPEVTHSLFDLTHEGHHFGSDSSDEEEIPQVKEEESDYLQTEDTLCVTKVPEGMYKSLDELNISSVKPLTTFYVPPCHFEDRGIFFYKSEPNKSNIEDCLLVETEEDAEQWPLKIPSYYSPSLRSLIKQMGCGSRHTKERHMLFKRLWDPLEKVMEGQKSSRRGLGFHGIMTHTCLMVTINESSNVKAEGLIDKMSPINGCFLKKYYP